MVQVDCTIGFAITAIQTNEGNKKEKTMQRLKYAIGQKYRAPVG